MVLPAAWGCGEETPTDVEEEESCPNPTGWGECGPLGLEEPCPEEVYEAAERELEPGGFVDDFCDIGEEPSFGNPIRGVSLHRSRIHESL